MAEAQETSHDPFEDDAAAGISTTEGEAALAADAAKGADTKDATGEDAAAGTPPAVKEGEGEPPANSQEKMIPESRFKAALKDVNDKLEKANGELQRKNALPVPDKDKDPDGYNLHVRIETSKELMREMKPDYQAVIEHYKKMADVNPDLNVAVAKAAIPAKFAYDLAKRDMELTELGALKNSDEYKEFLTARKAKQVAEGQTSADAKAGKQVADALVKVPNLNRATNAAPKGDKVDDSDELFAGAVL